MSGKEYNIRELGFIAKLYSMCKLQLFIVQWCFVNKKNETNKTKTLDWCQKRPFLVEDREAYYNILWNTIG